MRSRIWLLLGVIFLGRAALGVTDLINNGGFESGQPPWQLAGTFPVSTGIIPNSGLAHTGTNLLLLGKIPGADVQNAFQTISIPSNALNVTLSYFWGASSFDPANSVGFVSLISTTNSNPTVLRGIDTNFNANVAYQQKTANITSLTGKTVNVYFQLDALNAGIGTNTAFAVDDVSVLAFFAEDVPTNDSFANSTILTTNGSVLATNVVASKEPGEPKHAGVNGGHSLWWKWTAPSNGVVTINTDGSTFDTVLAVYTGTSVSTLTEVASDDDETGRGLATSQVKFLVTAGTEYRIAVDGKGGAIGVIQLNLLFTPDTEDPKVTIVSPKAGARLNDSAVFVQGTASDNLGVALVQARLENAAGTNDYQDADGTNNWSITLSNLIPGPNTIRVRAVDISENETTVTRTVTFVVESPIAVTINGSGTVSPNLNGQLLDVGTTYTMTAKALTGQVFSNWTGTGGLTVETAALTFTMLTNMAVQANFVPNPFIPLAGEYQGLFYDTNSPAHKSSGFFNLTVGSVGSFSAKVMVAGLSYSLSGQFSASGFASNSIVRKGLTPVSAKLHLDMGGGGITGELSDGVWTAELNAGRADTTPDQPGHFTLLIPGAATGAGHPGGDSYATIVVGPTGAITVKGVLADGTKIAQKALLTANGQWPFYVPLYAGKGSIFGWLTFSNGASSDITGTVDWFKLVGAAGNFYLGGFTNQSEATGSSFVFTPGVSALNFSDGQVWLANGNLTSSFTNQVTLNSASQVANQSANALSLKITTSTGLFKGSAVNPATGKAIPLTGVVLQKQNFGGGFFLGVTQTGRVFFGP